MTKKTYIILILFLVLAIAGFFVSYKNPGLFSAKPNNSVILFFSMNCPHCQNVEAFLQESKAAEKISFETKQLDNNQANVGELMKKASVCGLTKNIGIPFLWDGENSKCVLGDEDVINYFKDKIASSTITN